MNPFHFITHQAAQDLDASLAGNREARLPLRHKARNRGERHGVAQGLALASIVIGFFARFR